MKKNIFTSLCLLLAVIANGQVLIPAEEQVSPATCTVYVPVTFNPIHEDGTAMEIQVDNVKDLRMMLYDRWGALVYDVGISVPYPEGNEPDPDKDKKRLVNSGWEAKKKDSKPLQAGDYYYYLEAVCLDETEAKFTGFVKLMY